MCSPKLNFLACKIQKDLVVVSKVISLLLYSVISTLVPQSSKSPTMLSLLCIPADVLKHYIFKELGVCPLVVCALVCSQFRTLSSRRLSQLANNKPQQNRILQDIFRNGWTNLLSWFQARLRYPSVATLIELWPILLESCLVRAAEGDSLYHCQMPSFAN